MNSNSSIQGEVASVGMYIQKVHLYRMYECTGSRETCKHWYFCEDKDLVFTQSPSLRLCLISRLPSPSEVISDSVLYNLKDTGSFVKRTTSMNPWNSFRQLPAESQQLGLSGPLRPCPTKITSLACNIWQKYCFSCSKCLSRFLGLMYRMKQL